MLKVFSHCTININLQRSFQSFQHDAHVSPLALTIYKDLIALLVSPPSQTQIKLELMKARDWRYTADIRHGLNALLLSSRQCVTHGWFSKLNAVEPWPYSTRSSTCTWSPIHISTFTIQSLILDEGKELSPSESATNDEDYYLVLVTFDSDLRWRENFKSSFEEFITL